MALIKRLNVYSNITPNLDEGRHYILSKLAYLNKLNPNRIKTFINDNYRINADIAKLNEIVTNASYIIDYEYESTTSEIKYFKCYYVESCTIQSDYTTLKLSIDYWGTYVSDAYMSNILIKRCNRNIGMGYYDRINTTAMKANDFEPIMEALGGEESAQVGINYWDDSNVSIVFIASCVIARNVANTESVTQILPFACRLDYLRGLFPTATQTAFKAVEIATQVISGITSLKTTQWFATNDVKVLKAYLVPTDILTYDTWGIAFYSKSEVSNSSQIEFEGRALRPSKIKLPFLIDVDNMDINKKYFVGVYDDGLELTHFTENNYIFYDFIVNHDGVQCVVSQGDNMKDLTSHFEVSLIGNSISEDALQKIAWWSKRMSNVLGMAKSVGVASATNWALGLYEGVKQGANMLGEDLSNRTQASGTIGNSDGTIVFDWYRGAGYETKTNYPFYFTKYKSVINEKEYARYYGANFNERYLHQYVNLMLQEIKDEFDLIGEHTNFTDTYIKCNCCVSRVPLEACNVIKNKLANGIYYE